MDINFELYKVFYFVAKTKSFSEAAKRLYISQSAISQSIKTLEEKLGQKLFIRSTKKVELTKEGEILFKHIEPAVKLITKGENQIIENLSKVGSQIRIGASDTICRYFLVDCINKLHKKYTEVYIKVTNGTSFQCIELLKNRQVDIIVVNSPNTSLIKLYDDNIEEIYEFLDIFIANQKYFPFKDKIISLSELLNYPIMMLSKNSTTSEFLHKIFLDNSLDLVPAIELSSNDLLIDLAKIGLGIAFVPDFCIKDEKNLFKIKTLEVLPKRKLVMAYNKQIIINESAKYFINLLRNCKV